MKRENHITRISDSNIIWDIAVIGGGATGLGICLDAALRGYSVVLFESGDFSRGTSSRSTKLVHGGVRYLAKGDISLVMEALYERGVLMKNAPHLVKNQSFVIPVYSWFDVFLYTVGLKVYDLLAGRLSLGKSVFIGAGKIKQMLPHLKTKSLKGGVIYHDGQFDDSRLAINLAQSCDSSGACVLNYVSVTALIKDEKNRLCGLEAKDIQTNTSFSVRARSVINATGVFVNDIIRMDQPAIQPLIKPSQGVHIVVDKKFLDTGLAIMIPKTDDGRVLFAIPWHQKVIIGTTDTVVEHIDSEPKALDQEIEFILRTSSRYLSHAPTKADILSVFVGLRPLAAPAGKMKSTREISRSHKIIVSESGLITIIGGKWTTYRRMAEDTLKVAVRLSKLPNVESRTKNFRIHGFEANGAAGSVYGSDNKYISELIAVNPEYGEKLHPGFDYLYAHVVWAVREEMALTLEDVLTRRLRMLFLDASASVEVAPKVARWMAMELHYDKSWEVSQVDKFCQLAANYMIAPTKQKI